MKYVIKQEVAQAIMNYLAERPFGEVFELVGALRSLEPVEEPADEEDKTEE